MDEITCSEYLFPPFGALEQLGGGSLTLNWIEEALVLPRISRKRKNVVLCAKHIFRKGTPVSFGYHPNVGWLRKGKPQEEKNWHFPEL